ncbi:energy transducer TonB [Aliarcobacter vitoriensis]|uniref:TonB-dependent receptor n=1 Tax=Aliarcobacter vitoriensis TaxID=2011099 RepID=A0A366MU99_9BACT|nr:energy transducer TonB [Aliarcobacter vitoriensis]RBQ29637.1 TonB-dependent receptor [Aliarcobacter vitoriensis]RBQ32137.1 TonB-dependent receptor [Arcobacter sp. FW59]
MNRYQSSFIITSITYAIVGFFAFFVFANAFVITDKATEEVTTISLATIEMAPPPEPEPTPPEPEPEPEPVVEKPTPVKVPPKPKKPKKEQKPIEKPVEKVVEAAPVQQEVPVADVPIKKNVNPAQTQNLENIYLAKVKAKVEKHKEYPRVAKRLNQTGKVEVNFDVFKKGHVKNVKIVKKSKFDKLDEATLELLIKIAMFEPIPDELDREVWNITIPVDYQIQ